MTNKFAIYSGLTTNSKAPNQYFYIDQKDKNLFSYSKTFEEATKKINKIALIPSTWVQIVCLSTLNIIEQRESFNINKPIFNGYYSDEDNN